MLKCLFYCLLFCSAILLVFGVISFVFFLFLAPNFESYFCAIFVIFRAFVIYFKIIFSAALLISIAFRRIM